MGSFTSPDIGCFRAMDLQARIRPTGFRTGISSFIRGLTDHLTRMTRAPDRPATTGKDGPSPICLIPGLISGHNDRADFLTVGVNQK
jgi:hypothetical protein